MPSCISDIPALFTGLVRAVLGLALAFYPGLFTAGQQEAILLLVAAGIALSAVSHKTTVPKSPSVEATPASIQEFQPLPPA